MNLFRKKPIDVLLREAEGKGASLKKELGAFDLTMLGIGAIIGTGIFVLTGVAAAEHAGQHLFFHLFFPVLRACLRHFAMQNLHRLFRYREVRIRIATQLLVN